MQGNVATRDLRIGDDDSLAFAAELESLIEQQSEWLTIGRPNRDQDGPHRCQSVTPTAVPEVGRRERRFMRYAAHAEVRCARCGEPLHAHEVDVEEGPGLAPASVASR